MGVQINGVTGNVIATKGTFSGNVGIAGTLTYEDVTDIDAVGLITARSGIEVGASPGVGASISRQGNAIFSGITTIGSKEVGAGITLSPDGDIFFTGIMTGNGSGLTGVANTDVIFTDKLSLPDNGRIALGISSDLQIYHDSNHSRIVDSGTGNLILQTSKININNADGTEAIIHGTEGGQVEIYHANSAKLTTSASGVTVTGTVAATSYTGSGASLTGISTASTSDFVQVSRYTVPGEVSEVDITFDNTNYTHFKLFVTGQNIAYDANVYVRFKASGSWHTSSNYYSGNIKKHSSGFDSAVYGGQNQSYGYLIDNVGAENSNERWSLIADINTGSSNGGGFMRYDSFHRDSSGNHANTMGIVAYQSFDVLQGVRFYNSSGNMESGAVYTLYGLK